MTKFKMRNRIGMERGRCEKTYGLILRSASMHAYGTVHTTVSQLHYLAHASESTQRTMMVV